MSGLYEAAVKKHEAGDNDAAVALLVQLAEADPENEMAFSLMADIFAEAGEVLPAIECYSRAATLNQKKSVYKQKFINLVRFTRMNAHNPALKDFFTECLKDKNVDFYAADGIWHNILSNDPEFKDLKAVADLKSKTALSDPFFIHGLERMVVHDKEFENFLTDLRRALAYQSDHKPLIRALAQYCFRTEYIFSVSPEEESRAKGNTLYEAPREAVDRLEAIKKSIPALTPIDDAISQKVREQYEEFPYPRWERADANIKDEESEGHLRGKRAKILVAGCGTGMEAAEFGATFPDAEILAVDLSLSSLAYGINKTRELGIKNVIFKQGDILKLKDIGPFDHIASSGVLHHMDDPVKGWKNLLTLLKPGGTMRTAFYSRIARRSVNVARNIIREKSYSSDDKGIRQFRADASKLLKPGDRHNIEKFRDYYYMSECRDLLFHVQEHQYDLAQIKGLLDDLGLEFIKFHLPQQVFDNYRQKFPKDQAMTDVLSWAKFEESNPDTFKIMYRFWCRKKA